MNDDYSKTKSRRLTPWTGRCDSTPLESYIDLCTGRDYDHRHPAILASGEAAFLNSYELSSCRFCGSGTIVKDGFSETGIRRYLNLFSVMVNPPHNKYEKVKKILELGLENPVLVRFRD